MKVQTISSAAQDYLADCFHLPTIVLSAIGRRYVVDGKPAEVAKVISAGRAVDAYVRGSAAMERRLARERAAMESALSADLDKALQNLRTTRQRRQQCDSAKA